MFACRTRASVFGVIVRFTSEVDALFAAIVGSRRRDVHIVQPGQLRRPARSRRYRREIRVPVVANQYAGLGDEPVTGGERVARAQ